MSFVFCLQAFTLPLADLLTTAARYHTVHIKAASITLGLMLYRLINEDSGPLNTRYLLMCWA